jgi:NADPH-dependent 2,4-dienoyl-CoA reductase/sulfur reductase-like enzyme
MANQNTKVIVIGGDAAGLSAASAIRRFKKDWSIVVYEKGEYISYAACGIPYYVADWVKDERSMITITKEEFLEERKIVVKTLHEVIKVDLKSKQVIVKDASNGQEFSDAWDHLVIATGASPRLLQVPGVDLPRVFAVRGLETGIAIKKFIKDHQPKSVCLIGASYIGLEMAEGLKAAGVEEVTMIKNTPRLMPSFSEKISDLLYEELARQGVRVISQKKVKEFRSHDDGRVEVVLDPQQMDASSSYDFVVMGTGVTPNTGFLRGSGIALGEQGAIDVNEFMQTNVESVWAAGDCANVHHVLLGKKVYHPLATIANKQGRYAGYSIAGKMTPFPGTTGTIITKVFDLSISRTGLTLEQAKGLNFTAEEASITHEDMARYYPGTREVFISIVVDELAHTILGACIAGSPMAAKKIDVFVALIASKMKLEDIRMLDFSYAPPFSPVYDAILIAAEVASKKLR